MPVQTISVYISPFCYAHFVPVAGPMHAQMLMFACTCLYRCVCVCVCVCVLACVCACLFMQTGVCVRTYTVLHFFFKSSSRTKCPEDQSLIGHGVRMMQKQ